MKPERHIAKMIRELKRMTIHGHIDNGAKFVASEDAYSAIIKLKQAVNQNTRVK